MLAQKVFIFNPSSSGGGLYTFELYFQSISKGQFLNLGDYVQDTLGNQYEIVSPTTLPHTDGAVVTTQFVSSDTLPTEDSDYNSTAFTPGQVDARPVVRTSGSLANPSLYSGPDYEYNVTAGWDLPVEADEAVVGDSIVDQNGKEFIISFIDASNRFNVPIRVTEVLKEAIAPQPGNASMYRSTSSIKLFQGTPISDPARTVVRNRDNFTLDARITQIESDLVGGGSGSGTVVQDSFENTTGSTINPYNAVSTNTSGTMKIIDLSDEDEVLAFKGITTQPIADAATGNVAFSGLVKNVSLGFSLQEALFVAKDGTLTNTPPEIGSNGFIVGDFVIYVGHISRNEDNSSNKDLRLNPKVVGQL